MVIYRSFSANILKYNNKMDIDDDDLQLDMNLNKFKQAGNIYLRQQGITLPNVNANTQEFTRPNINTTNTQGIQLDGEDVAIQRNLNQFKNAGNAFLLSQGVRGRTPQPQMPQMSRPAYYQNVFAQRNQNKFTINRPNIMNQVVRPNPIQQSPLYPRISKQKSIYESFNGSLQSANKQSFDRQSIIRPAQQKLKDIETKIQMQRRQKNIKHTINAEMPEKRSKSFWDSFMGVIKKSESQKKWQEAQKQRKNQLKQVQKNQKELKNQYKQFEKLKKENQKRQKKRIEQTIAAKKQIQQMRTLQQKLASQKMVQQQKQRQRLQAIQRQNLLLEKQKRQRQEQIQNYKILSQNIAKQREEQVKKLNQIHSKRQQQIRQIQQKQQSVRYSYQQTLQQQEKHRQLIQKQEKQAEQQKQRKKRQLQQESRKRNERMRNFADVKKEEVMQEKEQIHGGGGGGDDGGDQSDNNNNMQEKQPNLYKAGEFVQFARDTEKKEFQMRKFIQDVVKEATYSYMKTQQLFQSKIAEMVQQSKKHYTFILGKLQSSYTFAEQSQQYKSEEVRKFLLDPPSVFYKIMKKQKKYTVCTKVFMELLTTAQTLAVIEGKITNISKLQIKNSFNHDGQTLIPFSQQKKTYIKIGPNKIPSFVFLHNGKFLSMDQLRGDQSHAKKSILNMVYLFLKQKKVIIDENIEQMIKKLVNK